MTHTRSAAIVASALLAMLGAGAQAQQVYRIVGPDGKVTFSDRAPDASTPPAAAGRSSANATPPLPYELSQVSTRFPVTLYTGNDCAPCVSARNLLINRGVPFTERTVNTNDDIDALKRLSNGTSLPFGTIGGQQLSGFSDTEWTQYLDAAGYPKQSKLPASYRRPTAAPLVAIVERPQAATPAASAPSERPVPTPAAAPSGASPSNPAGITF